MNRNYLREALGWERRDNKALRGDLWRTENTCEEQ